jgi:hypothetical protein
MTLATKEVTLKIEKINICHCPLQIGNAKEKIKQVLQKLSPDNDDTIFNLQHRNTQI